MRTMAWLDAALKPPKRPPQKASATSDDPQQRITRRAKFKADGVEHSMPDPGPGAYLLDIFFDVGPVLCTPMGQAPLGYDQLYAWQQCSGVRLTPWECRTLRDMSFAYDREKALGADPGASAPGSANESDEEAGERRERVSRGIGEQLRSLRRKP